VDNTAIEAFSGLSCSGIPALRDTKPQVFPGLEDYFPSNESMETANEGKMTFWSPPIPLVEVVRAPFLQ